jgi:putative phosphoribosyl transferase
MIWSGKHEILIPIHEARLEATLTWPLEARSLVLFAHGSGSSHRSPRNNYVAGVLNRVGIATLLMDLLSPEHAHEHRFDIGLLTEHLTAATEWAVAHAPDQPISVGYFGANTGAAAALSAASVLNHLVDAVVARGGRPDYASKDALARVKAPTLLIVAGLDSTVIEFNEAAYARLNCEKDLIVVPGATDSFEEPGTLEEAAQLAAQWFQRHLGRSRPDPTIAIS